MADALLTRVSKAMYRADEAPKQVDWSHLPKAEQRRYEVMAAAALALVLREPISEEELELEHSELSLPRA